jgi:hypothetical protein
MTVPDFLFPLVHLVFPLALQNSIYITSHISTAVAAQLSQMGH